MWRIPPRGSRRHHPIPQWESQPHHIQGQSQAWITQPLRITSPLAAPSICVWITEQHVGAFVDADALKALAALAFRDTYRAPLGFAFNGGLQTSLTSLNVGRRRGWNRHTEPTYVTRFTTADQGVRTVCYHQCMASNDTHSLALGYLLWLFGFTGAHRFYYGRPVSGTIWFLTLGLLGAGWLIDLFLIPGMEASADRRYREGRYSYGVAWLLLTFLGIFGVHRFYLGKWISGAVWLLTGGLFLFGYLYDYWTLNEQISERNA